MHVALAFVRRDFLIAVSYKVAFLVGFLGIILNAGMLYYVGQAFAGFSPSLARTPGGIFAFLLLGIAFVDYQAMSLKIFSDSIRDSQLTGTLEILMVSPMGFPWLLLCSSLWGYIFTSVRFLAYLGFGALLFRLDIGQANLPGAVLVLALSIACFAGMGVLLASLIILFKRGDSLNLLLGGVTMLLGGVVYPVAVLPGWLQGLAALLPFTHALEGMRQAVLWGYGLGALLPTLGKLVGLALVLFPSGLLALRFAVNRTRVTGTLGDY